MEQPNMNAPQPEQKKEGVVDKMKKIIGMSTLAAASAVSQSPAQAQYLDPSQEAENTYTYSQSESENTYATSDARGGYVFPHSETNAPEYGEKPNDSFYSEPSQVDTTSGPAPQGSAPEHVDIEPPVYGSGQNN